ncbi:MAG: SGNH/GDSL hydrolase family protein, partial [Planctomycetota bacterium]
MHRLFVIGDSISQQIGPYLQEMVSSRYTLDRKREGQVDDGMHANGGDSSHVLNYLRWLEQSDLPRPDLLLVNCGLHDIKVDTETGDIQVPLDGYRQNLYGIVELARRVADRL